MLSTPDGGVEIDPKQLFEITVKCIDTVHQQMKDKQLTVAAVGISAFWHCFLGIDADENPTTPIIHLFDTRSSAQVEQLKHAFDAEQVHQRTGCVVHTSYWPAKLLWLKDNHPDEVGAHKALAWVRRIFVTEADRNSRCINFNDVCHRSLESGEGRLR